MEETKQKTKIKPTQPPAHENKNKRTKKGPFKDTIDSIVVAFVIAMIIRTFFLQAFKIPSGSMLETLQIGDHILVNKLAYVVGEPKRNDVVVFEFPIDPSKDFIKRLIGLPGDTIEIKDKVLYRNGEQVKEPFEVHDSDLILPKEVSPRDNVEKFTVPKDYYFVMGDNRDDSYDGRFWGFITKQEMVGKAFIIYWSWGTDGGFDLRFKRILKLIK